MRGLAPPEKELARRLLHVVPYSERLSAGRLMPPVGVLREDVRSLRELHLLLAPDARSLPGVNLSSLAQWIKHALGDDELAGIVKNVSEETPSYAQACSILHEVVGVRLDQARHAVGDTT